MNYSLRKIILAFFLLFHASLISQTPPPYQWANEIGGVNFDHGFSICSDAAGNVYAMGTFIDWVDFDPGIPVVNLSSIAESVYVVKYDTWGNYVWAKSVGNNYSISPGKMCIDNNGNLIVNGFFQNVVDFDPGPATFTLAGSAMFVLKLDNNGNFAWAKKISGNYNYAYGMILDNTGNIYSCGSFQGTLDFDPGPGTFNLLAAGGQDAFLWKLDPQGNFLFAKGFGGTNTDLANYVDVDLNGNIFLTGYFLGTADFDPGTPVANLSSAGAGDSYIVKLDVAGNYQWAKRVGGAFFDEGTTCVTSSLGEVYCSGTFSSTVDFDPGVGVMNLTSAGNKDIYILKLDAAGNYMWAKQIGGTSADESRSMDIDLQGRLYTTGIYQGTVDFDPGTPVSSLTSVGSDDIFISLLDAAGNYVWAGSCGGTSIDEPRSVFCGPAGDLLLTGDFNASADMDPGPTTDTLDIVQLSDAFVVRFGSCQVPPAPVDITPAAKKIKCSNSQFSLTVSGIPLALWYTSSTGTTALSGGISYVTPFLQTAGVYTYYVETSNCTQSTGRTAITVTVVNCTGIEDLRADEEWIRVYPNPADNMLHLEMQAYKEACVINTLGQTILNLPENQNTMCIDISSLQPGIYFISVRTGEIIQQKKFVKSP